MNRGSVETTGGKTSLLTAHLLQAGADMEAALNDALVN